MSSHKRGTGTRQNKIPDVVARQPAGKFQVLHRNPQLPGDPEHAVCRSGNFGQGEAVAIFFRPEDASEYCEWKNGGGSC